MFVKCTGRIASSTSVSTRSASAFFDLVFALFFVGDIEALWGADESSSAEDEARPPRRSVVCLREGLDGEVRVGPILIATKPWKSPDLIRSMFKKCESTRLCSWDSLLTEGGGRQAREDSRCKSRCHCWSKMIEEKPPRSRDKSRLRVI